MKIFDNSNLNESYAGIVSPMTFSFINRVYRQVYIQFCLLFGVSKGEVSRHEDIFSNMLAYIGGKAYYQLHNWHRMFLLFPGYSFNGKFLEEMMGIPPESQGRVDVSKNRGSTITILNLSYIALRMVVIFILMRFLIRQFSAKFNRKYAHATKRLLTPIKLMSEMKKQLKTYIEIESDLTRDFSVAIANDMAVMIASGILRTICRRWFGKNGDRYAMKHMGRRMGLKSAEPGKQLTLLINLIRNNQEISAYILKHSPEENVRLLQHKYADSNVTQTFMNYIKLYGSRIPGELKLESVSFTDNPIILMKLIQNNLITDETEAVKDLNPESNPYNKIQPTILQKITLTFISRWLNKSVTRRELTRFYRTKIFDLARQFMNSLGEYLFKKGYILSPKDIFYLTIEDLDKISSKSNFRNIIQGNKRNEKYFQKLEMPRRISSESGDIDLQDFEAQTRVTESHTLHGTVACKGGKSEIITGTALVLTVFDPTEEYRNKILVTQQTDPGWTIIFPLLKAIVVERGGMLSHAAIISRELGIPCIMGVADATQTIKNGGTVTIDMNKSIIDLS